MIRRAPVGHIKAALPQEELLQQTVPSDLVELGYISDAWGVRGHVKLHLHAADSRALEQARVVWLCPRSNSQASLDLSQARPWQVTTARPHSGTWILSLAGLSDRTAAEQFKGMLICLSRADFPHPQEGEYYWVDLLGCAVLGNPGQAEAWQGHVIDVSDNGAHAILKVAVDGRAAPVLVPFVQAHVPTVDLKARQLTVDWPLEF